MKYDPDAHASQISPDYLQLFHYSKFINKHCCFISHILTLSHLTTFTFKLLLELRSCIRSFARFFFFYVNKFAISGSRVALCCCFSLVFSRSCLPLEEAVASIIMCGVKCYYHNDHRRCPTRDPHPKGLVKCQQGHQEPEALLHRSTFSKLFFVRFCTVCFT